MQIQALHIDKDYYRHSLEIKFSLSRNYLQEINSDIDVLEEVILNSIHGIYNHISNEIKSFITYYLDSIRERFVKTKNYVFSISIDSLQTHAMISFIEI